MEILTNNNVVFACGEIIEKGVWKNDPSMETYRIKDGDNYQYAVIADFKLYDVEGVPDDFKPNKYRYTKEQGFYLNPDFEECNNEYGISNELYDRIIAEQRRTE